MAKMCTTILSIKLKLFTFAAVIILNFATQCVHGKSNTLRFSVCVSFQIFNSLVSLNLFVYIFCGMILCLFEIQCTVAQIHTDFFFFFLFLYCCVKNWAIMCNICNRNRHNDHTINNCLLYKRIFWYSFCVFLLSNKNLVILISPLAILCTDRLIVCKVFKNVRKISKFLFIFKYSNANVPMLKSKLHVYQTPLF